LNLVADEQELIMLSKVSVATMAGALAFGLSVSTASAQGTTADGVFTVAQADRGAAAYASACASCHGDDLVATDAEAPSLSGFSFNLGFKGKSLGERFETIKASMPFQAPGTLTDQEYVDIIAYILSFNGKPAGDAELPADAARLADITVD
jgi:mono/diheme cytochrome c family protein